MLASNAEARLKVMTAWTTDPQLSQPEIDMLLADYKVVYRVPDLWDLDAAAAEGWRWKAGKVTDRFAFTSDVSSYSREQVHELCLKNAALYDRGVRAVQVTGSSQNYDPVLGNIDGAP